MIEIKPPNGLRMGQALYQFLYWLQENYQQDTFYLSDIDLKQVYKTWYDKQLTCEKCGKPKCVRKDGSIVCLEQH